MATNNAPDGGFRRWRRSRPFWGGLLLLIAGLELFLSANMTLGNLEVHMGPEGFLSYLLPLLLILTGVLSWVTPGQRLFYGVLGLLTAVYSLVGLNLGGFGLGMIIGIVGGALVTSWAPTPGTPHPPAPAGPAEEPAAEDGADSRAPAVQPYGHDPAATMIVPGFTGGPDDPHQPGLTRGPDDPHQPGFTPGLDDPSHRGGTAPLRPAHQADAATEQFPGAPAYPGEEHPPQPQPPGGIHRKTLVITLVPLALTAALLVAGGQTPARAAPECPKGLPSRSAPAELESDPPSAPAPGLATATKAPVTGTKPSVGASAVPSASGGTTGGTTEGGDGAGNAIVDGWNGFVEGVGDLLGIGDGKTEQAPDDAASASASAEPSTSAGPSANPEPAGTADPSSEASAPTPDPSGKPAGSGAPEPGATPGTKAPTPAPSLADIPCLGPRVFKEASAGDLPRVSLKPGRMEVASLTMYDSTYDGVVSLTTANGPLRSLKFSMTKAVNKPFKITVPEAGGRSSVKVSNELVAEGDVRFYTTRFEGKLFGIIPITFTPDEPPPLTLPVLWFTDTKIDLALVECKTMTFDALKQTEIS